MLKKLTYNQTGPISQELKDFLSDPARKYVCSTCGGTGEYEGGYGPKDCQPCNSRLLFFVDTQGKVQHLDWGDSVAILEDGSVTIERSKEGP